MRRGLKVRMPPDTVISLTLRIPPVALLHVVMETMDAFPTSAPVQFSEYLCPATGLPEDVIFTACADTVGRDEGYGDGEVGVCAN